VCPEAVRSADAFVEIVGFHYGSTVRDHTESSYTELEFEEAHKAGMPVPVFLLSDDAQGPAGGLWMRARSTIIPLIASATEFSAPMFEHRYPAADAAEYDSVSGVFHMNIKLS
jgi:hypothetical protein